MDSKALICNECSLTYSLDSVVYRCSKCNYPLEVSYEYEKLREKLVKRAWSLRGGTMFRYRELLPLDEPLGAVSLGEGWTSLHKSRRLAEILGVRNLYLKDETQNPTWSFKDRGSSIGVSKALEIGAKAVGTISAGNMAASMAAYAARAGITCIVFIPAGTPTGKIVHTLICNALVMAVDLPYAQIFREGMAASTRQGIYMVQADAPMRIEGQKTVSYEIWEQLGRKVPDKILVPTSSGGNLSAHWKGWKELYYLDFVEKLPAIVAVQPEDISPIANAFREGLKDIRPSETSESPVLRTWNPDPPSGLRVLRILRESAGLAETVSDEEILSAQKLLAQKEGIFAEPAGAISVAGLKKLLEREAVEKDETVVCVITGSGLKDTKIASKICGRPTRIKSIRQLERLTVRI